MRASVLDERFWTHLGSIALPLVVLAVICAMLYRIGAPARRDARDPQPKEVES